MSQSGAVSARAAHTLSQQGQRTHISALPAESGSSYLDLLQQLLLRLAALLLGLSDLQISDFFHVAILQVGFGFQLLQLVLEVSNILILNLQMKDEVSK